MAIENINIGTLPNDGSGDDLRTAFNKVNNNDNENAGNINIINNKLVNSGIPLALPLSEEDLNNYPLSGFFLTPATGLLNIPPSWSPVGRKMLINLVNGNYKLQLLADSSDLTNIAIRSGSNGIWGAWIELN